jgi:hypothetical protein
MVRCAESLVLVALAGCGAGGPERDGGHVRFARDVEPVLVEHCVICHDHNATIGAGDFLTAETAWTHLTGPAMTLPAGFPFPCGERALPPGGLLVVPGDPDASPLWQLVGMGFDTETGECPGSPGMRRGMPKLDPRGILADIDPDGAEKIELWIEEGARND